MSALARYLCEQGKTVGGYDKVATTLTKQLEQEGILVHYEDDFEAIPQGFKQVGSSLVIFTPAIPAGMVALSRFRESGITTIKRAQLLGQISKTMTCLAVAGTHGKTTTSAILAHLLHESGVKFTAFLGGILENYNTNYLSTGTDFMVVEADEFDRSFMQLAPDVAGITAIDPDHLDIYGDAATFEQTFHEFAALVPENALYVNEKVALQGTVVGLKSAHYQAVDVKVIDGAYHFNLSTPKTVFKNWSLRLPGQHNLANAVLAIAMALHIGVEVTSLQTALHTFPGVARRFTYRINRPDRVLIDDYAHHPTEIDAVYQAVNEMYPNEQVLAIFQPHLYSRTRDFMDGFVTSLSQFKNIGLLDIYPARELPIAGVTSALIAKKITDNYLDVHVVKVVEKDELQHFIKSVNARVVVMIGAGDIGVAIDNLVKNDTYEKI